VKPTGDGSGFGFCENCGIVYLLDKRRQEVGAEARLESLGSGANQEHGRGPKSSPLPVEMERPPDQSPIHRWRCPDCGAVTESPNEDDIEFLKREHVREYHPNRAA
jgi:hypothetical protein